MHRSHSFENDSLADSNEEDVGDENESVGKVIIFHESCKIN